MNRSAWLSWRIAFGLAAVLPIVGCHPNSGNSGPAEGACSAAPAQYVLSGGVAHPGARELHPGDTVASIIAEELSVPPGKPITIVLIRQAPEGKTRELVQLDADGHLMDPKQDWALRNGDELVFPGGSGSNSMRNPTGPPARSPD